MRKTFVTAFVVVLAILAFATCDSITGQNDDGLVTLSVNTGETAGNSRSLEHTMAKAKADYAEVIFRKGTSYYRAADYKGAITVKIPAPHTYGANDAIILLGRKDGTLLATGTLDSASLDVLATTTSVTFNVTSLTAAINADATTPAFEIVGSTAGSFTGHTRSLDGFDGDPCFMVPVGTNGINATVTITDFGNLTYGYTSSIISYTTGTAEVKFTSLDSAPAITGTDITINSVTFGTPLGAGVIDFTFNTNTEGKYRITFDIPVKGFDATEAGHLEWHIRGGITAGTDINGGDKNGVALLVTDSYETLKEVVVDINH